MNSEQKTPGRIQIVPGIWIVAGVLLLFAVRIAWGWAHQPYDIKQLAKDFSSIDAFQKPPVVNHSGTLLGMIHTTPQGVGVFIANVTNKTEQKICDAKDVDYNPDTAQVFGWSPDDSSFAYCWDFALHFANNVGEESPSGIQTNHFQSFAWLSPESCAYIDGNPKLAFCEKVHGQWQETASWPLPATNGKPRSLLAMGTNAVAWQTDNTLWQMDLSSGEIKPLYNSNPRCSIASVSYSKDADALLFVESTNRATVSSLIALSNGSCITKTTRNLLIRDAQWINKGKGYAYRIVQGETAVLVAKADEVAPEAPLFPAGQIAHIFGNGDDTRVYAVASNTNNAPSIWRCDTRGEDVSRLFSPWGFQDMNVHFQPALVGYAPLGNGHNERFVLIPPANFSRQKKYPLIIGMQGYDWEIVAHATYSQALAGSGAYVALTGYRYVSSQTLEELLGYTNNVLAVYNQLKANPNIDASRVYLFAFSSSTVVINELVKDYSSRWRGIMLFSPGARLPEAKEETTTRVLVTAGSDEEWLWEQFPIYQEVLCKAGIPMQWYVHPDSAHIERAQNTMYQRTLLMENMVFEK
jgi:Tol biopolymer transport system component